MGLADYLHRCGLDQNLAFKSADDIIEELGNSKTKTVSIDGFKEGAVSFDLSDEDNVKNTFQNMSNGANYVTKDDLNKYFHERVQDNSLQQMLKEIDTDKDGKISFAEFKNAMQSPLKASDVLKNL